MADKLNKVSLVEMLEVNKTAVPLGNGQEFFVRPLSLEEMVHLLIEDSAAFVMLYNEVSVALEGDFKGEMNLGSILVAAPKLVARAVAMATDPDDLEATTEHVQKRMAGPVQLIALKEIWSLSVPDPKKLVALLSEVMATLRKQSVSVVSTGESNPQLTPSVSQ